MTQVNLTGDARDPAEYLVQLRCTGGWTDEEYKALIGISVISVFLAFNSILGNTLILVALHNESVPYQPSKLLYRCLATTDLCSGVILEPVATVYRFSLIHEDWKLCRYAVTTRFMVGFPLFSVSLFTVTAISVDRLLALLLGLRYKHVVTLKRTYVFVIIIWVVATVTANSYFVNPQVIIWHNYIVTPFCIMTATFSYTTIFLSLRRHQNQMQVNEPQQPGQQVSLNMMRYRKAVYSALWVQVALVLCFLPYSITTVNLTTEKLSTFDLIVLECVVTLVKLNSTLNPFLYCWKISEVRQEVKATIRQALCCPSEV